MGGPRVKNTSDVPVRTPSKRSRTSGASSPKQPSTPGDAENKTARTPQRQRRRASDFASKKLSARKRQRNQAAPGKNSTPSKRDQQNVQTSVDDDEASVDQVIHQVRELMNSRSPNAKAKALAEALKRADEAFENEASDSSSDEDTSRGKKKSAKPADTSSVKEPTEISESDDGALEQPPKQRTRSSSQLRRADAGDNGEMQVTSDKDTSDDETDPLRHKAEIEALKMDDPMFYKFLEENEGSLLDFDMSDSSDDEEKTTSRKGAENGVDSGAGHRDSRPIANGRRSSGHKQANSTAKEIGTVDEGNREDESDEKEDMETDDSDEEELLPESLNGNDSLKHSKGALKVSEVDVDAKDGHHADGDATGYSESEDEDSSDEANAEAEAAAEAGLDDEEESGADVQDVGEEAPKVTGKGKKKLIFVDTAYLKGVKELLKAKRASLKACKDLLRVFRAGRDILPSSPVAHDKKTKQAMTDKKSKKSSTPKQKQSSDLDFEDVDDVFTDDGSFTSGKVTFASAKCYQQAMNLAIIGIQDALDRMLGKPQKKEGSLESLTVTWNPTDSSRWANVEQVFRPFVFHLLALSEGAEDADTLRFLLKRLEKLVPYTRENKVLLKKATRVALQVWSSDPYHVSQTTRLRAYILLTRLAHGPGNAETVLRACCNAYATKIATVCNPKTLPLIHFGTSCLVELFGVDMGASYTTAFSYLREMAISLRAVLVAKDRNSEVERIHNWSYINKLRLMSKILGKYGSEDELRPLIYPYVQVSIGIMRVQPTPRTIPLRFHVASYLSDLTAKTGVYIPVVPHLLALLRCSELRKKATHGSTTALEWRSILRVSDETVKTKPFLTGIIQGVSYQICKYFATISKHVSFPELAHFAQVTLKRTAKELQVSEWRTSLTSLAAKLGQTADIIADARSKADFSPQGAVHADGMLATVPGIDRERKMPIMRLYEVEHGRVMKEEKHRDDKQAQNKGRNEELSKGGDEKVNGDGQEMEESDDASNEDQRRPKKRKKTGKEQRAKGVSLSVPEVGDGDEEEDEIEDLRLDSDESEEDE